MDLRTACLVNCSLGKDAGGLFRLSYSIHQHTLTLDVIQVLDSRNYFQYCLGKHNSLHVLQPRLSDNEWTAG